MQQIASIIPSVIIGLAAKNRMEGEYLTRLSESAIAAMNFAGEAITADGCKVGLKDTCCHGYKAPTLLR